MTEAERIDLVGRIQGTLATLNKALIEAHDEGMTVIIDVIKGVNEANKSFPANILLRSVTQTIEYVKPSSGARNRIF